MTVAIADLAPIFAACGVWQVGAIGALQRIAPECTAVAQETSQAADEAHTKGNLALQYTKDVASVLRGLRGGVDLDTFSQVRELVEEKKARKAWAIYREMDDMALTMTEKANLLIRKLDEVVKEIAPENVREELGHGKTKIATRGGKSGEEETLSVPDQEAMALVELLGHADADVEEVQSNTRSMEQMDLFNASQTGSRAFEQVAEKETVAVKLFHEIKSVSDAIVDTLATGAAEATLCAQFLSAAAGLDAIFKALRLSRLVQKALLVVRRILDAFLSFINTSWEKFQNFFEQFHAGKTIKRFTSGIKNSFGNAFGKRDND